MDAPAEAAVAASATEHSLFVGDLDSSVSDLLLQESFRQFFPSVHSAKVITDPVTGRSKGYGFVRFSSEAERDRALEMQGLNLGGRPIRVSLATARRAGNPAGVLANSIPHPADLDPTNTTLFIGGLSAAVSEDQLRALFAPYGEIIYVKIPAGKGCGFVQYVERPAAEAAMGALNGQVLGGTAIRISWGRSTSRAPAARGGPGGGGPFGAAAAAAAALGGAGLAVGAYPAAALAGGAAAGGAFMGGFDASMLAAQGVGGFNPAAGFNLGPGAPGGMAVMAPGAAGPYGMAAGPGGPSGMVLYDPSNPGGAAGGAGGGPPGGVDRLNAAFVARQQQLLGGGGGGAYMLPRP